MDKNEMEEENETSSTTINPFASAAKLGLAKFSRTVTLLVGPQKQHFALNEYNLCSASVYLATQLSGQRSEDQIRFVEMPDEDPNVFAVLTYWLFFGKLEYCSEAEGAANFLTEAYFLGDKLQSKAFKSAIFNPIVDLLPKNSIVLHVFPKLIYQKTAPGSTLRHLFSDMWAIANTTNLVRSLRDAPEKQDNEFALDVIERLIEKSKSRTKKPIWLTLTGECAAYHEHKPHDKACA